MNNMENEKDENKIDEMMDENQCWQECLERKHLEKKCMRVFMSEKCSDKEKNDIHDLPVHTLIDENRTSEAAIM